MRGGFGQFCPVALASEVLTQRWALLVVRELLAGSTRFNDIRRGVPRMSATLLKQRLDALQRADIVERHVTPGGSLEYRLTTAGRELAPVLASIGQWGQRWARDIRPEDLDPGWLVWNIHRRLNTAAMPEGRTVIQIEFADGPNNQRYFWLVHQDGDVDVCLKHPGHPVDLEVRTGVRVLAEVWRGIRPIAPAVRTGAIVLRGAPALRRQFPTWLLLSVYAPIARAR